MDQGIDINTPQSAEGYADIDTEEHYEETYGTTALHYAVQSPYNPLETVAFLLDHGADIDATDKNGYGVLHYVVRYADPKYRLALIRLLARRGADINQGDEYGATPLHHAIWSNAPNEVVRTLTELGADVNARITKDDLPMLVKGDTPLLFLMRHESSPSAWKLTWLVTHGADVNARNHRGETPLLAHIKEHGIYSDPDAVRYLVFKGADASLRDNENHTALDSLKAATEKEDSGILAGEVKEMIALLNGQEPERKKHQRLLEWLTVYGSLAALRQDFDTLSHGIKRSFLEKLPKILTVRSETVEREAKRAFLLKALGLAADTPKASPSEQAGNPSQPPSSTEAEKAETPQPALHATRLNKTAEQETTLPPRARKLITACEQGDGDACDDVANFYLDGFRGFPEDHNKALFYGLKSCRMKRAHTCFALAEYIELNYRKRPPLFDTSRFNLHTAKEAYDLACQLGKSEACSKLREIKKRLQHTEITETYKKLDTACEKQLDGKACATLADYFADGSHGFHKNMGKALKYAIQACKAGVADYCFEVGRYYERHLSDSDKPNTTDIITMYNFYSKGCRLGHSKSCKAQKTNTQRYREAITRLNN